MTEAKKLGAALAASMAKDPARVSDALMDVVTMTEAKKLDFKCPGCRKVKPRRFATGTGWCSACVAVDAHLRSER